MAKPAHGWRHQVERETWRLLVEAGDASCCELVCLMPTRWIKPGMPWDLAHDRAATERLGKPVYLGPAHAKCNRSEGSRHWHATKRGKTQRKPRRWVV